jgi:hypothetical protein
MSHKQSCQKFSHVHADQSGQSDDCQSDYIVKASGTDARLETRGRITRRAKPNESHDKKRSYMFGDGENGSKKQGAQTAQEVRKTTASSLCNVLLLKPTNSAAGFVLRENPERVVIYDSQEYLNTRLHTKRQAEGTLWIETTTFGIVEFNLRASSSPGVGPLQIMHRSTHGCTNPVEETVTSFLNMRLLTSTRQLANAHFELIWPSDVTDAHQLRPKIHKVRFAEPSSPREVSNKINDVDRRDHSLSKRKHTTNTTLTVEVFHNILETAPARAAAKTKVCGQLVKIKIKTVKILQNSNYAISKPSNKDEIGVAGELMELVSVVGSDIKLVAKTLYGVEDKPDEAWFWMIEDKMKKLTNLRSVSGTIVDFLNSRLLFPKILLSLRR